LATSSVDGIGVEHAIQDVDSDTSHLLFAKRGFLGGPLPGGFHRISQFIHVLDTGGLVLQQVGTSVFGTERPDLEGIFFIVFVLF
jgi:hypothetical protein